MPESMMQLVLIAHLVFTSAMTGLIWFVQVVHYPLFADVGEERFLAFEKNHVRRTTVVVAPLMIGELIATIALLFVGFTGADHILAMTCVMLMAINWLSTALLQVPCHRALERGFDEAIHRRLVTTNWVRTISWTAKCVLAAILVA